MDLIFAPLFAELEAERSLSDHLREKSRELDRTYRTLSSLLNTVHSAPASDLTGIVDRSKPILLEARTKITELGQLVPEGQYYQWCDDFSFPLKNLTSSIALIVLLGSGELVTKHQVSHVLGLSLSSTSIHLSTEDYLHGIINMINDLPRLAVNTVTLGDYRTSVRLSRFVKELHGGFQVLNLKNDALRKRFDGIKVSRKLPQYKGDWFLTPPMPTSTVRCQTSRRSRLRYQSTRVSQATGRRNQCSTRSCLPSW